MTDFCSCFGTEALKVDKKREPVVIGKSALSEALSEFPSTDLCTSNNLSYYGDQASVKLPRAESFLPQPEGSEGSASPPSHSKLTGIFSSGSSEDKLIIESVRRTVEVQSMGAMKKLNKDSSTRDCVAIPEPQGLGKETMPGDVPQRPLYGPDEVDWDVTLHLHDALPSIGIDAAGALLLPEVSEIARSIQQIRRWPDGSSYEGNWGPNGAEGFGRLKHADGDTYFGQFCEGLAHGHGKFRVFDGSTGLPVVTYHGQWEFDIKFGQGAEEWIDGARFEGQYVDGRRHGSGIFFWPTGSMYQGQFCDDMPSGEGRHSCADGRYYSGSWKKGKMHGRGVFVFPGEGQYSGQFREGHREGEGVFVWTDGCKYTGEWYEDSQHGRGALTSIDGTEPLQTGIWINGQNTSPSRPHGKWGP